jgi:hypothetical protein
MEKAYIHGTVQVTVKSLPWNVSASESIQWESYEAPDDDDDDDWH